MKITLQDLYQEAVFPSAGAKIAPEDFYILLEKATGKDRAYLLAHPEHELRGVELKKVRSSLLRRLKREPIAYILGEKEFFGRSFSVNRATLIPRPETEGLIEALVTAAQSRTEKTDVVDVGTGSGAIAVTLALTLPKNFSLYALDTSRPALLQAKHNAQAHQVASRIIFLQSDLLSGYEKQKRTHDHLIIAANLPYVSYKLYRKTMPDLRYEPRTALVSPSHGLGHIRRLMKQIQKLSHAKKSVLAFIEMSPEQSRGLIRFTRKLLPEADVQALPDLAGKKRVLRLYLAKK